jgi:hypothetical protein
MKIEMNKNIIFLAIALILLGIGVYAYGTSNPSNLGHSAGELDLSSGVNGNAIFNDDVGIGTASPAEKLDVNGNVIANAFFYRSDERLKENIIPINNALDKVESLQGVSFNWKANGDKSIGLIAQDVEKTLPEIVLTDANSYKSVQYGALVAVLVEAIKEQQQEIDELKKQIANQ